MSSVSIVPITVRRLARSRRKSSRIRDPWIQDGVQQVHDQVDQNEADGDDQHGALYDWIVAAINAVQQESADAGQGEHLLDDHGATEQVTDLQSTQGDDRDERVLQGVTQDD